MLTWCTILRVVCTNNGLHSALCALQTVNFNFTNSLAQIIFRSVVLRSEQNECRTRNGLTKYTKSFGMNHKRRYQWPVVAGHVSNHQLK